MQLAVERGAAAAEVLADGLVSPARRPLDAVRQADRSERLAAGAVQHDAPVVPPERTSPDPGDLAERAELVEQPRLVTRDPGRQDLPLEDRGRDRHAGQLVDGLGEPLEGRGATQGHGCRSERGDTLPGGQEPGERRGLDRLDVPPQPGERPSSEHPEDLRVAPLALDAVRPEFAVDEGSALAEPVQGILHDAGRQAPAAGRLGAEERTVGPAQRARRPSSAAATGARKASGTPVGTAAPTPSR